MRILLRQGFMYAASDYLEVDLPNAALDVDFEGDIRVAVGVVHVRVALLLEPLGVDVAEPASGPGPHTDFAGKHYRCFPAPISRASLVNARLSRSRALSPAPICTRRSVGTSSLKRTSHSLRASPPRRTPPPLPCLTLSSPASPATS